MCAAGCLQYVQLDGDAPQAAASSLVSQAVMQAVSCTILVYVRTYAKRGR